MRNAFLAMLLLATSAPAAVPAPALRLIADLEWAGDDPAHGGFSALSVNADGTSFLALTDKGDFARGSFRRDQGAIVAVEAVSYGHMLTSEGKRLRDANLDSEGLAVAADGTTYVSFEANDRIAVTNDIAAAPHDLLRHEDFRRLQSNSSLEALAITPDGVLLAIPERSGRWERPFPVYRWKNGSWMETWSLPRFGEYLVTDASFGPDGRLYLLERELAPFNLGFSSRLRRFAMGAGGFDGGETLLETPFGTHGNLEGLSVWEDAAGNIRLTMISDDNFSMFLATNIVEYLLDD